MYTLFGQFLIAILTLANPQLGIGGPFLEFGMFLCWHYENITVVPGGRVFGVGVLV